MNIVAIIQARMGSTRLPGKVLMSLAGRPAIEHVVERARLIEGVSKVVVATTSSEKDDSLVEFCNATGIDIFRGDEKDVLDRYYQAALQYKADVVIRVTGDCPLLDPEESSRVLKRFLSSGADYACNVMPPTLPDGLDTEIMSMNTLERLWRNTVRKPEREHVTLHISNNPAKFTIVNVRSEIGDLHRHRWTLDEEKDYLMLAAVFAELKKKGQFGFIREVLTIFENQPNLLDINRGIERNEGLAKSLREE